MIMLFNNNNNNNNLHYCRILAPLILLLLFCTLTVNADADDNNTNNNNGTHCSVTCDMDSTSWDACTVTCTDVAPCYSDWISLETAILRRTPDTTTTFTICSNTIIELNDFEEGIVLLPSAGVNNNNNNKNDEPKLTIQCETTTIDGDCTISGGQHHFQIATNARYDVSFQGITFTNAQSGSILVEYAYRNAVTFDNCHWENNQGSSKSSSSNSNNTTTTTAAALDISSGTVVVTDSAMVLNQGPVGAVRVSNANFKVVRTQFQDNTASTTASGGGGSGSSSSSTTDNLVAGSAISTGQFSNILMVNCCFTNNDASTGNSKGTVAICDDCWNMINVYNHGSNNDVNGQGCSSIYNENFQQECVEFTNATCSLLPPKGSTRSMPTNPPNNNGTTIITPNDDNDDDNIDTFQAIESCMGTDILTTTADNATCQNFGTCTENRQQVERGTTRTSDYMCLCDLQHTGTHCEIKIEEETEEEEEEIEIEDPCEDFSLLQGMCQRHCRSCSSSSSSSSNNGGGLYCRLSLRLFQVLTFGQQSIECK